MKVGVNLINFGPGATAPNLSGWARLAEGLGFHMLMTSDHIATTDDVQARYPAPFYEPLTTLGWLAAETENILLGTTVLILPYRNPLETARAFANLDQLSGGRMILGVGIGWAEQEFDALNVPFRRRGAMTNEYLAAIKTLWSNDPASFRGEFVTFENVRTTPAPVQSPHPPIWVGGQSEAALTRTVTYADGWHPIRVRESWLRDKGIARLRAAADAAAVPMPALCPRIRLRITESRGGEDRLMGEGTIDQIHHDLSVLEELGCAYVLLDSYFDDVEATADPHAAWRMYAEVAEKVLDLPNETVR
ncbi:MAG: TIGR03619 family F420-dependent LLM class oxidoreductase [Pseudomonadota bacterium]